MNQSLQNTKWLLPFFCFFSTYFILNLWFKTPAFAMPNITGCQLAQATKVCSSHRLRIEIIQTNEDAELPDGTIIHQTPAAGHHIKERQTVFIAITHKPTGLLMPSLIGASYKEISRICSQHNLKPKFYTHTYPYPTDLCFCQWPSAEMPLNNKTLICYLANEEEKIAFWPNFKGQEYSVITSALAEQGIKTRLNLVPKPNLSYYIVDQLPKAGATIDLSRTDEIIADFKISTKRPTGMS